MITGLFYSHINVNRGSFHTRSLRVYTSLINKKWPCGPKTFPGLLRKGPQVLKSICQSFYKISNVFEFSLRTNDHEMTRNFSPQSTSPSHVLCIFVLAKQLTMRNFSVVKLSRSKYFTGHKNSRKVALTTPMLK